VQNSIPLLHPSPPAVCLAAACRPPPGAHLRPACRRVKYICASKCFSTSLSLPLSLYIYVYGRWRLIMPGRVQEKSGGILGSREFCFCWSWSLFPRWRLSMGSCKIQCGRLGLRFRSSRKAKQDLLHSTLLRLVRTPVLGERKLQRISSQRPDVF